MDIKHHWYNDIVPALGFLGIVAVILIVLAIAGACVGIPIAVAIKIISLAF